MSRRSIAVLCTALAACGSQELPPAENEVTSSTQQHALYGQISGLEFAIDAPWRVEPEEVCTRFPCTLRYDAIPLNVVFRDVGNSPERTFVSMEVEEVGAGLPLQVVTPFYFHEFERTGGAWQYGANAGPPHEVCRRWQSANCSGFESLTGMSEWDGTFLYSLRQPATPGALVQLKLTANIDGRLSIGGPVLRQRSSSTVFVRLGHPLPRFDARWSYGDLHYHSQGTDNEGESGYSHRSTLQAMSALGLDFTFATEHASNSLQFDNYADIGVPAGRILRDMSPARWSSLLRDLNAADGANAQVISRPRRRTPGSLAVPQLFLGGEVDVIPEVTQSDLYAGGVLYGNESRYLWWTPCYDYPSSDTLQMFGVDPLDPCPNGRDDLVVNAFDTQTLAPIAGRYFLKDVQGLTQRKFARQHLLHLPGAQLDSTFVPSNTTTFGGASRRLESLLREEYTQGNKGVTFLAHPVDAETGSDVERMIGPDIIPYSVAQLEDAFRNRAVLGLQLWNEDVRLRSTRSDPTNLSPLNDLVTWDSVNSGPQFDAIFSGLRGYDQMLLWSVDSRRTSQVPGLGLMEVRKLFLAGGSDAHGDFNYARKGYAVGLKRVSDLAMGKPRNLVMLPAKTGRLLTGAGLTERALAASDVTSGLASGQFVVTDGPIVRIAIDTNGNGIIDDADVPMGGDTRWTAASPMLSLIVEWKSTPEFGRLTRVDLTVNAFTASTGFGLTYNPSQAGVRGANSRIGMPKTVFQGPNAMRTFVALDDNTFLDPAGVLRIAVPYAEGYGPNGTNGSGRRVIPLDPRVFITADLSTVTVSCPNAKVNDENDPPDRPEVCEQHNATNINPPSALVIRAVGQTNGLGDLNPGTAQPTCNDSPGSIGRGDCVPRVVLTNPIWARELVTFTPPIKK